MTSSSDITELTELQSSLTDVSASLQTATDDITRITSNLINLDSLDSNIVNDYSSALTNSLQIDLSLDETAVFTDAFSELQLEYPELKSLDASIELQALSQQSLDTINLNMDSIETEAASVYPTISAGISVDVTTIEEEVVTQDGHLYPVKLVTNWTTSLKRYNAQLDDFIAKIEALDPLKINMTWLCKKCEAFCRRINYGLALLRYQIIKTLNAIYKQATTFSSALDPIVNFNATDILQCLDWVKSVIAFFAGPYEKIVQFFVDFTTYTPPLISEATTLVAKTATVPIKLMTKIELVADGKDGVQKQLAEAYKEYINLEMETISLADVTGSVPDKPVYAQFNGNKEQYENLKIESETLALQISNIWRDLCYALNTNVREDDLNYYAFPEKVSCIDRSSELWNSYFTDSLSGNSWLKTPQETLEYIFGEAVVSSSDAYWSKTFNTATYCIYPALNASELLEVWAQQDGGLFLTLFNAVVAYFFSAQSASTESELKALESNKAYYDFLLKMDSGFNGIITDTLNSIQELCFDYKAVLDTMKDLNKTTVFK